MNGKNEAALDEISENALEVYNASYINLLGMSSMSESFQLSKSLEIMAACQRMQDKFMAQSALFIMASGTYHASRSEGGNIADAVYCASSVGVPINDIAFILRDHTINNLMQRKGA